MASGHIFTCTKCGVAQYCGKDCQKKAWYGGHKVACQFIPARERQFRENVRSIDEKHAESNPPTAVKESNFRLLCFLCCAPSTGIDRALYQLIEVSRKGEKVLERSGEPSTATFLSNIDRVKRQEWWFNDAEPTMDEYMHSLKHSLVEKTEDHAFIFLLYLLAHDFQGTCVSRKPYVHRIPAERLFCLYEGRHTNRGSNEEAFEWTKRRRELERKAWKLFKETYHKLDPEKVQMDIFADDNPSPSCIHEAYNTSDLKKAPMDGFVEDKPSHSEVQEAYHMRDPKKAPIDDFVEDKPNNRKDNYANGKYNQSDMNLESSILPCPIWMVP